MALKDSWVDKKDEVDYILAKDINAVAHGVIDIEENLPKTIEEKLGEAKESGEFDGKDGLSAYELAIKNGTTTAKSEAEWLSSLKGDKGDKGDTGNTPDLLYNYLDEGAVVMPETSIAFDASGRWHTTDRYDITVGKEYVVMWNGEKCLCTAQNSILVGAKFIIYYNTVVNDDASTMIVDRTGAAKNATVAILEADYKIDPKYIPNMYYTEKRNDVEILPTSTAIDTGNAIMGELYVVGSPITLIEGCTYKVIYNGVEYESVASMISIPSIGWGIGLGDVDTLTTGTPSGTYPFVLATADVISAQGATAAVIPLNGSTNVTVSIIANDEIVHGVPEKYLPKSVLLDIDKISGGVLFEPEQSYNYEIEYLPHIMKQAEKAGYLDIKISLKVWDLSGNGFGTGVKIYRVPVPPKFNYHSFTVVDMRTIAVFSFSRDDLFIGISVTRIQ